MSSVPSSARTAKRSGPGRPRSQEAHEAVLAATTALLDEGGLSAVTIEAVSDRSGISKPTIYRYWPNRTAVAIDAFARHMAEHVPSANTGDARGDLIEQVRRVAAWYATQAGAVFTQLLAATTTDPEAAERLRDRFLAGRREETSAMWRRAVERGEARPDVGVDVAIDVLFAPIVYRLLMGHAPIDAMAATALADAALSGLLNEPASGVAYDIDTPSDERKIT